MISEEHWKGIQNPNQITNLFQRQLRFGDHSIFVEMILELQGLVLVFQMIVIQLELDIIGRNHIQSFGKLLQGW
jgi:hypothetical protein